MASASPAFALLHVKGCPTAYRVPVPRDEGVERVRYRGVTRATLDDEPGCVRREEREGSREKELETRREKKEREGMGGLEGVAARLRGGKEAAPRVSVGRLTYREGREVAEPSLPPAAGVEDVVVDRTSELGNPFRMGERAHAPVLDTQHRGQ
eukprot:scaffold60205_cov31-Tisochrysis_lutea.AAC.1